jgi:hypothetical protein
MIATDIKSDRRKTPRACIGNLVAHIDCRDGSDPIMVCVWDTSLGGACLLVAPDIEIPDRFDLVIDDLSRPVEKVWRRWSLVGVRSR